MNIKFTFCAPLFLLSALLCERYVSPSRRILTSSTGFLCEDFPKRGMVSCECCLVDSPCTSKDVMCHLVETACTRDGVLCVPPGGDSWY